MERSKLIEELKNALRLAKKPSNDEIEFNIAEKSFHIIFDDQRTSNPTPQEENTLDRQLDDGVYVKNIPYLAEWLAEILDAQPRVGIGLFTSENPKETGVAYEYKEGSKFSKHLLEIYESKQTWYMTIDRDYRRREDSPFNDIYSGLEKTLGFKAIDLQVGMLRLLPHKSDAYSIESLTPPLHIKQIYSNLNVEEVEAFDLLLDLYCLYLESRKTE
ncbi:TPA: hypothetical protein JFP82_002137 [Vibrio cholerae O1]|uniref:hypothetical protein n=1 Tax=Vibrio cholerae TaxID=666 RepID=UPI0004E33CDD|nr:hypothetical protein [Vibrio cholerae]KFE29009.1 hypothetical protein DN30_373 [Vibrio cholerae]TXY43968.1 hypothetical protein FXE84_01125 [Vibrio cholerae]HAU9839333.1 hypothetical protein [Vibrio cholerae O1]